MDSRLSILYLRCGDADNRGCVQRHVDLSILYLRCQLLAGLGAAAKPAAFNSLFEMPPRRGVAPPQKGAKNLSILYLRCSKLVILLPRGKQQHPFNSLFEMQKAPVYVVSAGIYRTFNSLFEMRGAVVYTLNRLDRVPFNSLFEMLHSPPLNPEAAADEELSILYLRCWVFLCLVFAGF